jgi:hypothetical protein
MGLAPKPTEITITGAPVDSPPRPATPSYAIAGPRVSPLDPAPKAPGLIKEIEGNWEISVFDQTVYRLGEIFLNEPEDGFNPWDHLDGYELYADSLVNARSTAEVQQMKARIDNNQKVRETLARGEWGWIASLLSGVGDPVSLIPIPGSMGMGFLKGAARASAGNAALAAGLSPVAMGVDPTTTWEEQAYSIGGAALFGAAAGGVVGLIGRKAYQPSRSAFNGFARGINEDEGMNISRAFNAKEEEYDLAWGNTRSTGADGVYEPVAIRDLEDIERTKQASDDQIYHYDDQMGWVLEADRGQPAPRPIPDEIRDELGVPAKVAKRAMTVDDVAIRAEYENGRWKAELGETAIRSADELVTYRQLEAVERYKNPKLDTETPQAFRERVRTEAMRELEGGRVSADVMLKTGLEKWVDKLNFSPVSKAIKLFRGDNFLTDVPLQLGGDYGWAIRANKFGYKTPPSVLVRAMRHGASFVEIKQALDAEWLKFVQQNQAARGKTWMSLNVTASAEGMRARGKAMMGQKVITKEIFSKMAGRAVFDPEPFKIDGFDVVPEARAAAKAWTRVAQRYDSKARELGIFYDQRSLQRTVGQSERRLLQLKQEAAERLWGGNKSPAKLQPAVKVGDKLYFGDTHDMAVRAAMDELGPDIEVGLDNYGYVDNLVTSDDPPAPERERINAAAVRVTERGRIPVTIDGANHVDALMAAERRLNKSMEDLMATATIEDGFITSTGRFVDREEAATINGRDEPLTTESMRDDPDAYDVAFDEYIDWVKTRVFYGEEARKLLEGMPDDRPLKAIRVNGRVYEDIPSTDRRNPELHIRAIETAMDEGVSEADINAAMEAGEFGYTVSIGSDHVFLRDDQLKPDATGPSVSFDTFLAGRKPKTQAPKPAPKQPKFRPLDDVLQGRIESLSERQREVWDDMQADIAQVTARRDEAKAQLDIMDREPHRFRDQFGNQEPYWARFWHKPKIVEQRAAFEKLLAAWYRRTQALGAEERAAKTVDDMMRADPGLDEDIGTPGLPHLHRRTLDIPNSFRITDPELGELAIADFIETDMEIVADAYTRNMGTKIETAEMFGDTELFEKMQDIKQHFRERYLQPAAAKGKDLADLIAKRDEYLGWVSLTRDAVLGGLRNREAYNVSNRIARGAKSVQVLNSMGRVMLTAAPEAMRNPMINGFGNAFRATWVRLFADLKTTKANTELSKQTGTIFEMAMDRRHSELYSLSLGDPNGGHTWIERKLERAIPSFFKLVGLSQWTVMMKDITMFTTQHRIMDLARKVDEGNNEAVLAAMGISRRDAKMLASMPAEENAGVILPSVDQWQGPDGRRARTLFLDALAGAANRAIITPSIADKSLLFSGMSVGRRGARNRGADIARGKRSVDEKTPGIAESDWFSVPLQFMSFGIATNQKLILSGLQGRDHSAVAGALAMLAAGVIANYLRTPSNAMMNKSYDELLLEAYEASGLGGFWFADINGIIERATRHSVGIRPALGMDPRFGKTTDVGDYVDMLGPAPGTWFNVVEAFVPGEQSMTNRAQAIRRAIPYNNVIWWGSVSRDLATMSGRALE